MDKEININTLIGEIIDGKYKLEKILRTTSKSWVFEAREIGELSPERSVAIKILKPGQGLERESQFRKEVSRLAVLDTHKNIATLYNSGISNLSALRAENKTKFFYAAMELVPGKDLEQQIKDGRKFSLEEILNISQDVCDTSMYIKEKVGGHYDLKLKNIKFKHKKESENKIYVLDFGGRLRESEFSNDVLGVCSIFKELLKHRENPEEKIPNGLEKIVNEASKGNFETLQEFKNAIRNYCIGVSRRKFLKKFSVYSGGIVLFGGLGYYQIKDYNYRNSIGYIVDEIENTPTEDHKALAEQFIELGIRICNKKIKKLYSDERVKQEFFPYATTDEGKWYTTKSDFITSGFSVKILRTAFSLTGDSLFNEKADKLAEKIIYNPEKERGFNPIRFLHAGKQIPEAAAYFEDFYDQNFGIYDLSSAFTNYFQNPLTKEEKILDSGSFSNVFPFLFEAAILKKSEKDFKKLISHTKTFENYMIRKDNSTRDLAKINFLNSEIKEGNKYAFTPQGCFARWQTSLIDWFVKLFEYTQNQDYLKTAEKFQNYYIRSLLKDNVPYADLSDEYKKQISKNLFRDTSAATRNCKTLAYLAYNLDIKTHENFLYKSIKALMPYISKDEYSDVIISEGCVNFNIDDYPKSCLIWAVNDFLETSKILKKNLII